MPDQDAQVLGRYRLVSLLGEGGMGKVYKAWDATLERSVALKILPAEIVRDPSRVERFVQEARAASTLSHPHVVTVYDIGEERPAGGGEPVRYIAMEIVDGVTLRALLDGGSLDLRKALKIAGQVAEGLSAAHALGIVHRDLKPENVMVNSAGYAKILDFGLAKLRARDATPEGATETIAKLSEPGTVMGTAGYMAPEQAQGRPVDHRADVFSLGCILYEVASGRRAFRGDSAVDTLHKIIYGEPEPIRAVRPDVPPDLARILRKALAKDPDERYQSAKDLALDLKDLLREIDSNASGLSLPGAAAPSLPGSAGALAPRTHGPLVAAVAVALLLGAAGTYVVLRARGPKSAGRAADSMQVTRLTANGKVISASLSPDAKLLAYVVSDQGEQSLSIRQIASGQALTLVPPRRSAYWGHTFAPDGASLYYGLKDATYPAGAIYQISTLGGAARKIVEEIDSPPAFSPDGKRFAFVRAKFPTPDRSAVMIANADGSDVRPLAAVAAPEYFAPIFFGAPSWSPDGRLVAAPVVDRVKRKGWIVGIDAASGSMRTIADPGWEWAAQVAWLPDQKGLAAIGFQEARRGQVWLAPYPSGVARPVTRDLFDYRIVSLSADGRSLVTVASDAVADIWICRDGALPKRIAASKREGMYGLAATPDGRIVLTSFETGKFDVFTMDEAGGSRALLTRDEHVNRYPAVAPNGTIVYSSQTAKGTEICRMRADGSDRRVLATTAVGGSGVDVSPDGKSVVYEDLFADPSAPSRPSAPSLARVSIDGGPATRLTNEWFTLGSFSPDGRTLAGCVEDTKTSRYYLATMPADGGPVTRVAPFDGTSYSKVRWSRDGKALVVNTVPGDRANLWLVPLDASAPRRLTSFDEHTIFAFAPLAGGKGWLISRGDLSRDAVLLTGFRLAE
jgi:Tol biopolymer transport system component